MSAIATPELPPGAAPGRLAMTKAEAARSVSVSTRTLEIEAAAGRLKTCKVGRKVLIRTSDLAAWLESRLK